MATDPMLDPSDKFSIFRGTGNGSKTAWDFNFAGGYIRREHIKAYTSTAGGPYVPVAFTWLGTNTINISPAVPNGVELLIYRDTPKDKPLVDFNDGARIDEKNLDITAAQAVFAAAEMVDRFEEVSVDFETVTNTANTALSTANSALSASGNAVSTANSARDTAISADGKATTALANSTAAVSTANAASSAASSATSTANTAASVANVAKSTADQAALDAASAVGIANATTAVANNADATAAEALQVANNASLSAGEALMTSNAVREEFDTLSDTVEALVGEDLSTFVRTTVANVFEEDQTFGNVVVNGDLTVGGYDVYHEGNLVLDIAGVTGLQAALDAKMDKSGGNFTSNVGITRGNAYTTFHISANAGQNKRVLFQSGGVNRWYLGSTSSAENGNNSGSNFDIGRYADDGSFIDVPLSIDRATGRINANNPFYQQIKLFSQNQTDTLVLERGNTGNNYIVFKTSAAEARLGMVSGNLTYQDTGAVNRTVWHSGNADLHSGIIGYSENLNLDTQTGAFTHSGSISSTTGRPSNQWHQVLGMFRNANVGAQLALNVQGDGMSYRRRNNGTWGSWRSVLFADNPTITGTLAVTTLNGGTTGITVNGSGGITVGGSSGITVTGAGAVTAGELRVTRTTAGAVLRLSSNAAQDQGIILQTAGSNRWFLWSDATAEGGSNSGSNFSIRRYSDTGASLGNAVSINRATGAVTLGGALGVGGAVTASGNLVMSNGSSRVHINGVRQPGVTVAATAPTSNLQVGDLWAW